MHRKNFLAVALTASLAGTLIGCSDNNGPAPENSPASTTSASPVSYNPPAATPSANPASPVSNNPSSTAIRDLNELATTADRSQFAGRELDLNSIEVQDIVAGKGFWVGQTNERQLFVRAQDPTQLSTIRKGEQIHLSGKLEKPPTLGELKDSWQLDPSASTIIAEQGIYLAPTQIQEHQAAMDSE